MDYIEIKTQEDIENEVRNDLIDNGVTITNWSLGGRFRRIVAALARPIYELYNLLNEITLQMYLHSATGVWLERKAKDEAVEKKLASKTEGKIILGRNVIKETNVVISKGRMFKTDVDSKGEELRYISTEQVILYAGIKEIEVPVIAEFEGSKYNVGNNQIKNFLTHIDGIDYIIHDADWITTLGIDDEDDESLRKRTFDKKEKQQGYPEARYRSFATDVIGVKDALILSHPRGQGTVDVVIVTEGGAAPPDLIEEVQSIFDIKKDLCADVLVVSATTQAVDMNITLKVEKGVLDLTVIETIALTEIDTLFKNMKLGEDVILAKFISVLMKMERVENVLITLPVTDIAVDPTVLALKGNISVLVERNV